MTFYPFSYFLLRFQYACAPWKQLLPLKALPLLLLSCVKVSLMRNCLIKLEKMYYKISMRIDCRGLFGLLFRLRSRESRFFIYFLAFLILVQHLGSFEILVSRDTAHLLQKPYVFLLLALLLLSYN